MTKTNKKKLVEYWKTGSELDYSSAEAIAVKAKRYVQAIFFSPSPTRLPMKLMRPLKLFQSIISNT
jgi:hypothetical protein